MKRPEPGLAGGLAAVLLVLAGLLPWSYPVVAAHFAAVAGWQLPAFWLAVAGLLAADLVRDGRVAGAGLAFAAAALLSWPVAVQLQLNGPDFRYLGFQFELTDVLDQGWFAALIALVLVADRRARLAAAQDPEPGRAMWLWSLLPGLGLVRYELAARGRLWLLAFAAAVAWIHISSVPQAELEFANINHVVPEPMLRNGYFLSLGLALLVYLLSIADTWRELRFWRRAPKRGGWLAGWRN